VCLNEAVDYLRLGLSWQPWNDVQATA
jgi:hypothetical protein